VEVTQDVELTELLDADTVTRLVVVTLPAEVTEEDDD